MESMTYQEFYNKFLDKPLREYYDGHLNNILPLVKSAYEVKETRELIRMYNMLSGAINRLVNYNIPKPKIELEGEIRKGFIKEIERFDEGQELLKLQHEGNLKQIEVERSSLISEARRRADAFQDAFYNEMKGLIDEMSRVQEKKPEIEKILSLYDIPCSIFELDLTNKSMDDLREALSVGVYATNSMSTRSPILTKILSILYLPYDKKFSEDLTNVIFTSVHLISLVLVFYILKPYSMAVVAVFYLSTILANMFKIKERQDILRFAYCLADSLDVESFLQDNEEYQQLLKDIEKAEAYDTSEAVALEVARYTKELDDFVKENDPSPEIQKALNLLASFYADIDKAYSRFHAKATQYKETQLSGMVTQRNQIKEALEEVAEQYKPLGSTINPAKVLSLNFKLASVGFEGRVIDEDVYPLELKNIIFRYKTEEEFTSQISHIKLLLVNMLCNVKYLELAVDLVDTERLGRDFTEFLHEELDGVMSIRTSQVESVFKGYMTRAEENIRKLGKQNIIEYNRAAEKKGMVTLGYKLLILLTKDFSVLTRKEYATFLEYSATTGNIIWIMHTDPPNDKKDEIYAYNQIASKLQVSDRAYQMRYAYDRNSFESPSVAYEYSIDLGKRTMMALEKAFQSDPGDIRWFKDFKAANFPDGKEWQETTLDGILINYGYRDGDPSKSGGVLLCDGPVHGLMVGATGAGKSALANFILASLFHRYSPEWLLIVMVDFKNAEFPMYGGENAPPHVRVISGTKDGEYAVSIFDYLLEEMDRRTALFNKYKVNHIAVYNKMIMEGMIHEEIMPRILFYIDEFTVMYVDVPPRILQLIEKKQQSLANLARFCGCHMLFQTQSFAGTMGKAVMEQFQLRVSLRAASATAETIIGTKLPSLLPKRGQCYTNESLGEDQRTTKRWVIPFVDTKYLAGYLPKLVDWAENGTLDGKKHLNRKPPLYNEDELYSDADLLHIYKRYPKLTGKGVFETDAERDTYHRTFILGERTAFNAKNILQNNFILARDSGESVFCGSEDKRALLNLVNTFILQLQQKDITFLVNCQDLDNFNLLDLYNKVSPDYQPFLDRELDSYTLYDVLSSMQEERMRDQTGDHEIIFILLVNWENMYKVGIEPDPRLVDKYKSLIMNGPKVNIHYVLFTKEPKSLSDLISPCKHRISGKLTDNRESLALIKDEVKVDETFGIYVKSDLKIKFKIYQCPVIGTIAAKELIMKGD